jgi:hypothetical protein
VSWSGAPESGAPIKDRAPLAALVAANLVPLAGALWLGWNVAAIVQLYWMENLIIGVYAALKFAFYRAGEPLRNRAEQLFTLPFFCLHYGAFCAIHGFFLQVLLNVGDDREAVIRSSMTTSTWPFDLITGRLLASVAARAWNSAPSGTSLAIALLIASHGVSFFYNYLRRGENATVTSKQLMIGAYNRIFILHAAILIGGLGALMAGSSLLVLVVLVALKTGLDTWSHVRSHGPVPAPAIAEKAS